MKSLTEASIFSWLRDETSPKCVFNDLRVTRYLEADFPKGAYRYRLVYLQRADEVLLMQWLMALGQDFSIAVIHRKSANNGIEVALKQPVSDDAVYQLSQSNTIELFDLPESLPVLNKTGILVMDMDSTAIQIECIDELAKMAGVGKAVSDVTERAMQGELDFEESLRARVAQLKGANAGIIDELCQALPLMPGLVEMTQELQSYGWYLVLASGGFTAFVHYLKDELSLDAAFANELVIDNGHLTGEVKGQVVDAQFKADTLMNCADQWGIAKGQRLAIGDGANDIPMIQAADFGVAFHAKPKLAAAADIAIRNIDLRALPFLLIFV
ncbi:phosphoserine phosphatase SerB [Shewanella surugensis]|uniref:Phosphoserine phosphatase n=1 Tax=Shewanella surugensis TaxID=212020 RepID=A0ABT0LB23_9GAMM|nr:phosphoserine phosphatase SerB [Shewanella surugensis]MCL1124695.1 phosphoserine phosphatase SerB [Shewanella surugensis]